MERRRYSIPALPVGTALDAVDWMSVPVAPVDCFFQPADYTPKTTAQMVFVEGYGFVLRMTCLETAPKATYRCYNDPVYGDSCMEFFCDWLGDGRYVNMEMNPLGTLLSCIGSDRHDRTPIAALTGGEVFPVQGEILENRWTVTAGIPLSLLTKILGTDSLPFRCGYAFRGNFYKCGDETAVPHYGMWNPVGTAQPDFHRPEYFGEIVIE